MGILFGGPTPEDGASAYEIAVENGFIGTEIQWLASLVGAAGASAYQIAQQNGYPGTATQWLQSLHGANGASAYQIAQQNGFVGNVQAWLNSLVGPAGPAAAGIGLPVAWTPNGTNINTVSSVGAYAIVGDMVTFSCSVIATSLFSSIVFPFPVRYGIKGLDIGFNNMVTTTQFARLFCDANSAVVTVLIGGTNVSPTGNKGLEFSYTYIRS